MIVSCILGALLIVVIAAWIFREGKQKALLKWYKDELLSAQTLPTWKYDKPTTSMILAYPYSEDSDCFVMWKHGNSYVAMFEGYRRVFEVSDIVKYINLKL